MIATALGARLRLTALEDRGPLLSETSQREEVELMLVSQDGQTLTNAAFERFERERVIELLIAGEGVLETGNGRVRYATHPLGPPLEHLSVVDMVAAPASPPETLRLALNGNLAQADVTVNDTSTTPPPPPTFALAASTASVDEGSSVVITLTTTNLAAGVSVTYSLSGTGLTAADVVGGVLTGVFTVDSQGIGTTTIGL